MLPLRRRVANAIAKALLRPSQRRTHLPIHFSHVRTGLQVEMEAGWPHLKGKRVGLIVNHTAVSRQGKHLIDLLATSDVCQLVRIFAPEHGLRGVIDEQFSDERDAVTGLPVVSLYGKRTAPEPEHLADLDAIVFDIQDAGVRFYTYTATMCLAMRAAAEAGIEFIVLDRPNLLRCDRVLGPVLDRPFGNLAEYHPLPLVHGLTAGELARFANAEYSIGCALTVIACDNYSRDMWYEQTLLPWLAPSPNLRTLKAAVLYPALGMLERSNISVGRGTDAPFEYFGAPWMDGRLVAERLNDLGLAGVSFLAVEFTPTTREFAGEKCSGCYINLLDRDALDPVELGLHIASVLVATYEDEYRVEAIAGLLGSQQAVEMLRCLRPIEEIVGSWQEDLTDYLTRRQEYLLY